MNKIKLLFFATLRDRAGTKAVEIEVPVGTTVSALKMRVVKDYPSLDKAMETAIVAVNREYAPEEAVLPDRAEVAFFPPVSGG